MSLLALGGVYASLVTMTREGTVQVHVLDAVGEGPITGHVRSGIFGTTESGTSDEREIGWLADRGERLKDGSM